MEGSDPVAAAIKSRSLGEEARLELTRLGLVALPHPVFEMLEDFELVDREGRLKTVGETHEKVFARPEFG